MKIKRHPNCTGCKALVQTPDGYECSLNVRLGFSFNRNKPIHPKPKEACLKPKTFRHLKEAQSL